MTKPTSKFFFAAESFLPGRSMHGVYCRRGDGTSPSRNHTTRKPHHHSTTTTTFKRSRVLRRRISCAGLELPGMTQRKDAYIHHAHAHSHRPPSVCNFLPGHTHTHTHTHKYTHTNTHKYTHIHTHQNGGDGHHPTDTSGYSLKLSVCVCVFVRAHENNTTNTFKALPQPMAPT